MNFAGPFTRYLVADVGGRSGEGGLFAGLQEKFSILVAFAIFLVFVAIVSRGGGEGPLDVVDDEARL